MISLTRLIAFTKHKCNFNSIRSIYTLYETEYNVSPFVKLLVRCPFNVEVCPLDVHEYPNCDKLFIKLKSDVDNVGAQIHCKQQADVIQIDGEANNNPIHVQSYGATYKLILHVPVKADVSVETSLNGNISMKNFNGCKTILQTDQGVIKIGNLYNSIINVQSDQGNLYCDGVLQAGNIILKTARNGVIETGKVQGDKLYIKTSNGNILTKSCYCNESTFETVNGNLLLDNVHKKCNINIHNKGNVNITGFDGTLMAKINSGDMDVQLSKLYDSSKIEIAEKGNINLRLAEDVQNNTDIKILSAKVVSKNFKMNVQRLSKQMILLKSISEQSSDLNIFCAQSDVLVENSSWAEMLKLKGINFK